MSGRPAVLVVEPDRVLSDVYREYLIAQSYDVVVASGAQDAITAADSKRPDVVVLELQLPKHSGAAFLYEFRSYADWQDIPVIVHSHMVPSRLREFSNALTELGVQASLYKPRTTLQQLHGMIVRNIPQYS